MTTDFYRRYLAVIMDKLDETPLPDDIIWMSSSTIVELLSEHTNGDPPDWCKPATWNDYAGRRYERAARRLDSLLAREHYRKSTSDGEQGWTLQADSIVVWEKADAFGRSSIKGEIPDFLYDDTSSVGDTFVLWHGQTEDFLGRKIDAPGSKWWWNR